MSVTSPRFEPAWTSATADSYSQVQSKLDEAAKKGRHVFVDVGNLQRTFSQGLTLDPKLVTLCGDAADWRFPGTMDAAITFTQSPNANSDEFGQSEIAQFYGFKITAGDGVDKILKFDQSANGSNQENAVANVHHCILRGGQTAHWTGSNSFLHETYRVKMFEQKRASIELAANIANGGEQHCFDRCTFDDSNEILNLPLGNNIDIIISRSSIDYEQGRILQMTGGQLTIVDSHTELREEFINGNESDYFALDAGANLQYIRGRISRSGGSKPNIVTIYGQGGYANFENVRENPGFDLGAVDVNGRPTICNKPGLLSFWRQGNEIPANRHGLLHWNKVNRDFEDPNYTIQLAAA